MASLEVKFGFDELQLPSFGVGANLCKVEGCETPKRCKGYCQSHYEKLLKHGDPLGGRQTKNGEPFRFANEVALSDEQTDCIFWPYSRSSHGYGSVIVDGVQMSAHRYICTLAHGEPEKTGMHAAHSCGKGKLGCVNPFHLRWATPSENYHEAVQHGAIPLGENHVLARLSDAQVSAILSLKGEMKAKDVALKFGISRGYVSQLWTGKTSRVSREIEVA